MHYFEGIVCLQMKNDMNYDMYDTREPKERELQLRTSKKFKLIVVYGTPCVHFLFDNVNNNIVQSSVGSERCDDGGDAEHIPMKINPHLPLTNDKPIGIICGKRTAPSKCSRST